jgi:hypothetical protein
MSVNKAKKKNAEMMLRMKDKSEAVQVRIAASPFPSNPLSPPFALHTSHCEWSLLQ